MCAKKVLTLVMPRREGRILLGMKKRGFGQGRLVSRIKQLEIETFNPRWNGFGGKVEKGESVAEGAARELLEESCLNINWWKFLDFALNIKKLSTHEMSPFGSVVGTKSALVWSI